MENVVVGKRNILKRLVENDKLWPHYDWISDLKRPYKFSGQSLENLAKVRSPLNSPSVLILK
jgi:hypothetical protein